MQTLHAGDDDNGVAFVEFDADIESVTPTVANFTLFFLDVHSS